MKKLIKKQAGGTPIKKKVVPKYKSIVPKATQDSTQYYKDKAIEMRKISFAAPGGTSPGGLKRQYTRKAIGAERAMARQRRKGKPGYDKDGFPIKK